jgi:hypothetical protein
VQITEERAAAPLPDRREEGKAGAADDRFMKKEAQASAAQQSEAKVSRNGVLVTNSKKEGKTPKGTGQSSSNTALKGETASTKGDGKTVHLGAGTSPKHTGRKQMESVEKSPPAKAAPTQGFSQAPSSTQRASSAERSNASYLQKLHGFVRRFGQESAFQKITGAGTVSDTKGNRDKGSSEERAPVAQLQRGKDEITNTATMSSNQAKGRIITGATAKFNESERNYAELLAKQLQQHLMGKSLSSRHLHFDKLQGLRNSLLSPKEYS